MKIKYTLNSVEDIKYWHKKNYTKIKLLVNDIAKHPLIGLGKPEALKCSLNGQDE
jgi:toxin YoeB